MKFNKKKLHFIYLVGIIYGFGLVSCPLWGQGIPQSLTAKDYQLWSTLKLQSISSKGNWISYSKVYNDKNDTLFINNYVKNLSYKFAAGNSGQFSNEEVFAFLSNNTLNLINLADGNRRSMHKVLQYEFTASGDYLVASESSQNQLLKLMIYDKYGIPKETLDDVIAYRWNNQKTKMAYSTFKNGKHTVRLLNLEENIEPQLILSNTDYSINNLSWNRAGNVIAFYGIANNSKNNESILYAYQISTRKLYNLTSLSQNFNSKIDPNPNLKLSISDDGTKVFFGYHSPIAIDKSEFDTEVAIWNTDDKRLYPHRKQLASLDHLQLLAVWWFHTNKIVPITSNDFSWIMLSGDQKHAITANPLTYEPQYKRIADMDYYLNDLMTGEKKLLLKKHNGQNGSITTSPNGKYITYYRNRNWWVYTIENGTHINVTKDLNVNWDNENKDPGNELYFWGNAGWTSDHKWILYYDYNDIWAITPDGKTKRRLTKGKEKGIQFRFVERSFNTEIRPNYSSLTSAEYPISDPLLIHALDLDGAKSTYYLLDFKKGERQLINTEGVTSNLIVSKDKKFLMYQEQNYDQSPSIKCLQVETSTVNTLVSSNTHQKKIKWGHSKMIHFYNKHKHKLNGALFYPAGYNPKKKYPMIVYIYATVSNNLNYYVNPSNENTIGFNISNFTTRGYFVLLPDIVYDVGNPGISATDCVQSAVKKVSSMNVVDPSKIGLLGHSFGGYETNFIISQTNIFRTAVSGSAVSDIVGHYFSINTSNKLPESWRYENQQYRMQKSFYDDPHSYYQNSPLAQASQIQTPLLSWVGLNDTNVDSKQGITFYIALRRLQKKNILLTYPDEGHILSKPKNQKDLTDRVQDWFDYYLKEEPMKSWMAGTNTTFKK